MKKFSGLIKMIKDLLEDNLLLFALILLLGLNQLVYSYVPGALLLNLILLGLVFLAYNFKGRKIYVISVLLTSLLVYGLGIFTNMDFFRASIYSLTGLFILLGLIYFTLEKDTDLESLYTRIFRLALALINFVILYVVVYLISFLIDQVFFLDLPYDGLVFRLANSLASMLGLFVLFARREPVRPSRFFQPLFEKILPALSLVLGVLALIYHLQILFGFIGVYYSGVFYFFLFFFYLAYLFSGKRKDGERDYLLPIFFLLVLSQLFIRLDLLGRVKMVYTSRGQIHDVLASLAILAYLLYISRRARDLDRLRWLAIFMAFLVFMPPLGFVLYESYGLDNWDQQSSSILEDHRARPRDPLKDENMYYLHFSAYGHRQEALDVSGYSYLLESYLYKEEPLFERDQLRMELVDEGKSLLVSLGDKKDQIDIYNKVKEMTEEDREDFHTLDLSVLGLKIELLEYYYNRDYYSAELRVLLP